MPSAISIQLRCPNCGQTFYDVYAGVLNLSGEGFKADFEPGFVSDNPISELLLYQCNHCGFTERSLPERFSGSISGDLKTFSRKKLPEIQRGNELENPCSSSKFEVYARYLEFSSARSFDIGKAYLQASWINDSDECREKALEFFESSISDKDTIGSAEAPFAAYLSAEMARKLGKYLAAERLYHVAAKLSGKSPELAIRTYSFLLEMSDRQSTAPTDEPIWNFSDGLILDPLDYYHAKILTSIAVYYRYTQQEDAVALYNRAFDLCKPALERTISQKQPEFEFSQNGSYLTMQLAKQSLSTRINGFWVDSSLLNMGIESLKELKKLKSIIQDAHLIRKVEVDSRKYADVAEMLEKDLRKHSKREAKADGQHSYQGVNQQRLEKLWNTIIFIGLGLVTSLAASTLTYYGLQAFNIEVNWVILFFGTMTAWLVWAVGQRILRSFVGLFGRLFKRDFNNHTFVQLVIATLVFLGGGILAIVLGGWPVIISILLAGVIMFGLNLSIQGMKRPKMFRSK